MAYDVKKLLEVMLKKNISDIHLKVNSAPLIRLNGELMPVSEEKLTPSVMHNIVSSLLSDEQKKKFENDCDIDFAFSVEGLSRFRVNVSMERGNPSIVLRVIPTKVKSFKELNLPAEVLTKLCKESRGLILVAGITGAGKTTTLNAMIDYINSNYRCKIITIEDPIEYYHFDNQSSISQREIGRDAKSFEVALKYALRQDPDIIVIGEMRDFETMKAAITAAETGHLVLATIHTINAAQTIERIINSYSPHLHQSVRAQLSNVIRGVIAQRLVLSKDSTMRYPITEILISTSHVRSIISEGKFSELNKVLEQGAFYGMKTFDQNLYELFSEGKITLETALENATNEDDVALRLKGIERTS